MPAAPQPPASSAVKSQGRGGADNDGFHTRSDKDQTACAKAHAFLSRDELEVAPGAALAYRRVRAAGAAARTRKARPLQAPRWISATLWKPRYRVSAANELLRALNQPQAGAGATSRRRRPSKKDGRTSTRLALALAVCKARERAALL
jgi:hypothetical protein